MCLLRALNYILAKLSTQTLKSIKNCVFGLGLALALTCLEISPEQLCFRKWLCHSSDHCSVLVWPCWLLKCVVWRSLGAARLNSFGPSLEGAMAAWALQVMRLQADVREWKNIAHVLNSELVSPVQWAVCEVCSGFVPADTAAVFISLLNLLCSCLCCSPV